MPPVDYDGEREERERLGAWIRGRMHETLAKLQATAGEVAAVRGIRIGVPEPTPADHDFLRALGIAWPEAAA